MQSARYAGADKSSRSATGRFAPSPTGRMHLGNIYAALMSYLSVRRKGGRWLLRIEDIDRQRSRQEYADTLMSDLEWLGMHWDAEPEYQSRRDDIYRHYLSELSQRGLLYPCKCTRAELMASSAPHASDGSHPYRGTCRPSSPCRGADGLNSTLRLFISDDTSVKFYDTIHGEMTVRPSDVTGDFVVRRRDGAWAYQFAVAIDDALMNITEVVRGDDLLLSTAPQRYLQQTLSLSQPDVYTHLPLLVNEDGIRLSKRDASLSMEHLRHCYTPEGLVQHLCKLAGIDSYEAIEILKKY